MVDSLTPISIGATSAADILEIFNGGHHARDVFINIRPDLKLIRRNVWYEIFAECGQTIEILFSSPAKAHVRRESLVGGTRHVIDAGILYVDRTVGKVVNRIDKDLGSDSVRRSGDSSDIDQRTRRVRSPCYSDESRLLREQREKVLQIKARISICKRPEPNRESSFLQVEPNRYVCLVVKFGDDDFVASVALFRNGLAHEAHERGAVQSEHDFIRVRRIHEIGHSRACSLDNVIHFTRKRVRSATLNHPVNQVIPHGIDNPRRQLRSSGVIEEDRSTRLA
jgi:hypothetical protein